MGVGARRTTIQDAVKASFDGGAADHNGGYLRAYPDLGSVTDRDPTLGPACRPADYERLAARRIGMGYEVQIGQIWAPVG
jgi:hypothetical protein